MDLEQELAALLDALHAAGVEYALCGGLALAVHGEVAAPPQLDILLAPQDVGAVEPHLRLLGYTARTPLQYESADAVLTVRIGPVSADAPAWRRRTRIQWRGRDVDVLPLEDVMTIPTERAPSTKVDMSPEAITSRIRQVSQLRKLCLSLGKANPAKQPPPPRG